MGFWEILIVFLLTLIELWLLLKWIRPVIVQEYQVGLRYKAGRFVKMLPPGMYWINAFNSRVVRIDKQIRTETVPGQEVLSLDQIGLKVSLSIRYEVEDPVLATHSTESYVTDLYQSVQIALRVLVGAQNIEALMAQRNAVGEALMERCAPEAEKIGLKLHRVEVKDIMFPGELKKIFAEEIKAKKEGQAALERARGESAALRNLANAAKMLENNPALRELRLLQALASAGEKSNNVIVTQLAQSLGGNGKK